MKSVLASIQPRWCEKIAAGEKTDEIRKNAPKLLTPFKCYIYQSKAMWSYPILRYLGLLGLLEKLELGKGKVIGEFICDVVAPVTINNDKKLEKTSCVSLNEMWKYAAPKSMFDLKAWHISDLVIYDKPKDLCEFYKVGTLNASDWEYQLYDGSGDPSRSSYASYLFTRAIRKPPQSWCYVEEL